MTPKQEKFCIEYLIDLNGAQAAVRAGYAPRTARITAAKLLTISNIQNRIKSLRDEEFNKEKMEVAEAEALLARIARGEIDEECIASEGTGDGCSRAFIMKKQVSAAVRVKALELIGKRNNLFAADTNIEIKPVIITGEGDIRE